ncbi:unnamed protein product [Clonostachys byssicola]|uniref:Uncharacterized protein n=1 Tax=Clonostachys byssicola TaxID=160290 RepID=A0A9N9UCA7_9HYPO|nr:unnamed protein product [Clonostachys byssicola]
MLTRKSHRRKRLLTGFTLQALQQLTGPTSGLSDPFIVTVIVQSVNFFAGFPSMWLVEQRLFTGAVRMCLTQYIIVIVAATTPGDGAASKSLMP